MSSLIAALTLVSSAGATFPGENDAAANEYHLDPSAAPSGPLVVFTKTDGDIARSRIMWIVTDHGGAPNGVTPRRRCYAYNPAFAPSGTEIAFISDGCRKRKRSRNFRQGGLLTIRIDGTGLRRVPGFSRFDTYGVDWSPTDASTLAVSTGEIVTVERDGTGRTQLTSPDEDHTDVAPSFSPDGQTIAFERIGPAPRFIGLALRTCVVPVGGGEVDCVLPPQSTNAVFSPEGDELVFQRLTAALMGGSFDSNWWELRTADADGDNESVVTSPSDVSVEGPTWAPAP